MGNLISNPDNRFSILGQGSLMITAVVFNDTGEYRCSSDNGTSDERQFTQHLTVYGKNTHDRRWARWCMGTKVHGHYGAWALWCMARWCMGTMVHGHYGAWHDGAWHDGAWARWCMGTMVHGQGGALARWCMGTVVHVSAGNWITVHVDC